MEILTKLGIEWQQIVAQAVNFGLIATILTLLVYKPLLRTIDERRSRIQKSLKDAEQVEEKMREIEKMKQQVLSKADQEAGSMLETAKKETEKVKEQILASARHEADQIIEKGKAQIAAERQKVYEDAQKNLTAMIMKMTQKILEREFTPADQDRLVRNLEKDISSLKI